jgi:hypothetical protein
METSFDQIGTLTDEERDLLFRCELAIKTWKESFYLAGSSLRTVRDCRLHCGTHATFATYVRDQFGLSKGRVSQLIGATEVVDYLRKVFTMVNILPANERQIRPLLEVSIRVGHRRVLDLEEIGKVWAEVLASAPVGPDGEPRITGRLVREVVDRMRQADDPQRGREQRIRRRKRALRSAFSMAASDSRNDPAAHKIMAEYARALLQEFEETRDGAEACALR